jgi:hypothetical protein
MDSMRTTYFNVPISAPMVLIQIYEHSIQTGSSILATCDVNLVITWSCNISQSRLRSDPRKYKDVW